MRLLYQPSINTSLRTVLKPFASLIPPQYRFGLSAPFTLELPNGQSLKIIGNETSYVSKVLFWEGVHGYEPHLFEVFTRMAQQSRVLVDVGANIGYYSLLARAYHAEIDIVSFEPMPAALHYLKMNLDVNRINEIIIVDAALSDVTGQTRFYEARNRKFPHLQHHLTGASGLNEPGDGYLHDRPIEVPVTTLDATVEQHRLPTVDLLKIDAEGAEASVLRGGEQTLRQFQPVVIFECDPGHDEEEIEAILNRHGYTIYNARPAALFPVDSIAPFNARFHDFIAVPEKWREVIQATLSHY